MIETPDYKQKIKMDRLWRSPEMRRRFEVETGLAPLPAPHSDEWLLQQMAGRIEEYHTKFLQWSARMVGGSKP